MKNIISKIHFILFALTLTFGTLIFGVTLHAQANPYPHVQRLENGLTVLIIEDNRFPIVSSRLYVKAGSSMEKKGQYGISHLLEHMVFKGSKTHPNGVEKLIEDLGGYLNAYTSYDQTVYLNDLPSSEWKTSLEAIQGIAFNPLLRDADLAKEREVVRAELKQRGDSQGTQLLHLATALSLKGTDYEHPVIGYDDEIINMTSDDIRDYIKKNYDPSEMLLVVAGDIKVKDIVKEATRLFSSYKNLNSRTLTNPYTDDDIATLATGFQISIQKGKWNKSHINISFPIPHENSEHATAISMLSLLLDFDDNSLLPSEFRFDNKIVDQIASYSYNFERIGLFNIYAQLDSGNIPLFMEKILHILSKLNADDFSDAELRQARIAIENSFWYNNTTIQDTANTYGDLYWSNPADPLGKVWLDSIQNVNREQINTVLKKYIRPDAMSLSILLPEEENLETETLIATQKKIWKAETRDKKHNSQSATSEMLQIGNKTLILTPDTHIPFVSVSVNFLGGESLLTNPLLTEKGNTVAVPSLTASTITTAIKGMNNKKFTAYLSQRDISVSANSDSLTFQINAHGSTKFSTEIFKLITDILEKPRFDKKDLEEAKRDKITEILTAKDSVIGALQTELRPFLFPNHPYGSRVNGDEEAVNAITQKDLRRFWQLQKEQAMVISVAGDYDKAQVIAFVEQLQNPKNSVNINDLKIDAPTWTNTKDLQVPVEGRQQEFFGLLFKTVDKHDKDAPALRVLATALGGFNGLLHQELREKRNLGYSAGPMAYLGEKAGYLAFYIIASAEHTDTIHEQFKNITDILRTKGISEKEINSAKASMQMDYINNNQTVEQRANAVASPVLFGHDAGFSKQSLDKALAVTKEDIDRVIDTYLIYDTAYTFHAGSK